MNESVKRWLQAFGAGCFAAMISNFVFWLFWQAHIMVSVGCELRPGHLPDWPYHTVLLGGFYGLLLLIDWGPKQVFSRGLLFGLIPSLLVFAFFFPQRIPRQGALGYGLGWMTPVFILFYNSIWGLITAGLLARRGD